MTWNESSQALACRQYQLPHVIEQGGGAPAVLTILYLEVCARIGLPMKAALLEEGRYAVLWPEPDHLRIAGEEVVIDVFSEGALFLLSEVSFCSCRTLSSPPFEGGIVQLYSRQEV